MVDLKRAVRTFFWATNERLHPTSFALVTGDVADGGVYLVQLELARGDAHAGKPRRDVGR